jgi:hypothetical protein
MANKDSAQEAPYLTHLVRHHGQFTLTAPQNMGLRRQSNSSDHPVESQHLPSSLTNPSSVVNQSTLSLFNSTYPSHAISLEDLTSTPGTTTGYLKKKRKKKKAQVQGAPMSSPELDRDRERTIIEDAVYNAGRSSSPSKLRASEGMTRHSSNQETRRPNPLRASSSNSNRESNQSTSRTMLMNQVTSGRPRSMENGVTPRQNNRIDIWQGTSFHLATLTQVNNFVALAKIGLDLNDGVGPPAFLGPSTPAPRPHLALRTNSEPPLSPFPSPPSPPPAYLPPSSSIVLPPTSMAASIPLIRTNSSETATTSATGGEGEEEEDFVYNAEDPLVLAWEIDRLAGLSLDDRIHRDLGRRSGPPARTIETTSASAPISTFSPIPNTPSPSDPIPKAASIMSSEESRNREQERQEIEFAERAKDTPRVARALSIYAGKRFAAAAAEKRMKAEESAREESISSTLVPSVMPGSSGYGTGIPERLDKDAAEDEEEEEEEEEEEGESEMDDRIVTSATKNLAAEAAQRRMDYAIAARKLHEETSPVTEEPPVREEEIMQAVQEEGTHSNSYRQLFPSRPFGVALSLQSSGLTLSTPTPVTTTTAKPPPPTVPVVLPPSLLPVASSSLPVRPDTTSSLRRAAPRPPISRLLRQSASPSQIPRPSTGLIPPLVPDYLTPTSPSAPTRRPPPPPPRPISKPASRPVSDTIDRPPLPPQPFSSDRLDAFTQYTQQGRSSASGLSHTTPVQVLNERVIGPRTSTSSSLAPPAPSLSHRSSDLSSDLAALIDLYPPRSVSVASSSSSTSLQADEVVDIAAAVARSNDEFIYTDLDVLISRLEDNDSGRNYNVRLIYFVS